MALECVSKAWRDRETRKRGASSTENKISFGGKSSFSEKFVSQDKSFEEREKENKGMKRIVFFKKLAIARVANSAAGPVVRARTGLALELIQAVVTKDILNLRVNDIDIQSRAR